MKSFSISRVAHYARYHYSVTRFNYLSFILAMIALPTLFGILGKDLDTAKGMLIPIYIFAGVAMAVTTTRTMRGRGTKIMDGVLPVTAAERHVFNVFNLTVVYPVLFVFVAAVALGIVSLFNRDMLGFGEAYSQLAEDTFLEWKVYVVIQIGCSTALLINLLARRNLFAAYLIAFLGFIALFLCVGWVLGVMSEMNYVYDNTIYINPQVFVDVVEPIVKVVYSLLPVAIYAICYAVLRKRQIKW